MGQCGCCSTLALSLLTACVHTGSAHGLSNTGNLVFQQSQDSKNRGKHWQSKTYSLFAVPFLLFVLWLSRCFMCH